MLHEMEDKIEDRGVRDAEASYKIAQAFAVANDKTSALRVLKRSIENGFFAYPYFISDPLLIKLRAEPEFTRLLGLAQQRHEAFRKLLF